MSHGGLFPTVLPARTCLVQRTPGRVTHAAELRVRAAAKAGWWKGIAFD